MTVEENRQLLLDTYNDLRKKSVSIIESLYFFDCLKLSGFKETEALDLIDLLKDLYIKDENGSSIGALSDNLYNYIHNGNDIKNKRPREILSDINFYDDFTEEDKILQEIEDVKDKLKYLDDRDKVCCSLDPYDERNELEEKLQELEKKLEQI